MERCRWKEGAWWRYGALALLALPACTGDITELVVVVDSDLRIPDEIDRVLVVTDATAIGGQLHEREAALAGVGALELPLTLSLVHTGGPLGPVRISAIGRRAGDVVTRRAEVSFVEGRSIALVLQLTRACVGVICSEGETCANGACRSVVVRPGELVPLPSGSDAGPDDGGRPSGTDAGPEVRRDAGVPSCTCTRPNAKTSCSDGACRVIGCEDGYDDCDTLPENGCETSLATNTDCGACRRACSLEHAAETCASRTCTITSCELGWADCDRDRATGCERSTETIADCGACGVPCARAHATSTCSGGACRVASCTGGWTDADGADANGCETPPVCDPTRCACTATCMDDDDCTCATACPCSFECVDDCRFECTGAGTSCSVDARDIDRFESFRCTRGATCTVDATGADRVDRGRCENGATCDVECNGVRDCRLECRSGAACLLRCGGAESCSFSMCEGGAMSCPGGIEVCNRGCP